MRPSAARRRLLRALAALVSLGAGCEVLVDGTLGPVHCTDEGALGPPACPEGAVCRDGACAEQQLERALGARCARHEDCGALDFCLDPALFDVEGPRGCSRACCSSSDCDPARDAVCWIPDGGGSGLCRIGREVGRPDVGARLSGAPCAAPGDCRSGICNDGACVDACCSDTSCATNGAACRLTTGLVASGPAWACQAAALGDGGYFEPCARDEDCASGLCAQVEGSEGSGRCTIPCCGSEMCPDTPGEVRQRVGCAELAIDGRSTVRACITLLSGDSLAATGAPCSTPEDCRSGMCIKDPEQTQRFCSDVCCSDASCGDAAFFGCHPRATGESWALRCEPK
ncbi:hypothetical protein WME73_23780 [Sorangium sp. So ce302]|uniref:hypothetical protein n=1 Tax=Sorangium sp. So ce302 TaxID=3133297 RepID=UPI003F5DECE9